MDIHRASITAAILACFAGGTIANAAEAQINDVFLNNPAPGANAVFTVTLTEPAVGGESVNFATANFSAIAGIDYVHTNGTITFASGQTTAEVSVTILSNSREKFPGKSFWCNLSNPVNCTLAPTGWDKGDGGSRATHRSGEACIKYDVDMRRRLFFDNFTGWPALGKWTDVNSNNGNDPKWEKPWNKPWVQARGVSSQNNPLMLNPGPWEDVSFRWQAGWSERSGGRSLTFGFCMDPNRTTGYQFKVTANYNINERPDWVRCDEAVLSKIGVGNLVSSDGNARQGTRLGCETVSNDLRPCAVRLDKVETGLRIRCYVGFFCVIDYIDTDAPIYSGYAGMFAGDWDPPYFHEFEIWENPLPAPSLLILK
jgi:Calx-beta domain.